MTVGSLVGSSPTRGAKGKTANLTVSSLFCYFQAAGLIGAGSYTAMLLKNRKEIGKGAESLI